MAKGHYIILETHSSEKNAVLILLFQTTLGKKIFFFVCFCISNIGAGESTVLQLNATSSFGISAQLISKNLNNGLRVIKNFLWLR